MQLYNYFASNYNIGKPSPKGWYTFDCPLCDKAKKMAIAIGPTIGKSYVKCWSCGYSEFVSDFIMLVEKCNHSQIDIILNKYDRIFDYIPASRYISSSTVSNSQVVLPTGYNSLLEGDTILGKRARTYLEKRGFDLELLDLKGFGYCNEKEEEFNEDFFGYIIIPFKIECRLKYFIGRDYIGNFLRYKNPSTGSGCIGKSEVLYNEDAINMYDTIYITEGWADAETVGKRGVATLGWSLSSVQKRKLMTCSAKNFVFLPDVGEERGESFYKKAVKVAIDFIEAGKNVYVVNLDCPEFNSLGKDVNEIGKSNILLKVKETPKLTWARAMDIIMNYK